MPDLDHLGEQLRADVSQVTWAAADRIRAVGDRRTRTRLLQAGSAAAVLAVITAVAILLPGSSISPVGPTAASPSSTTSPPAAPRPSPSAIPDAALLTAGDVRPAFSGTNASLAGVDNPNPFVGCGLDGLPGARQPHEALAVPFIDHGPQMQDLLGGESILRYSSGGTPLVMTAINRLVAGACAPYYQVISRNLGGDASVLLHSTTPAAVVPQYAHGTALYYAIVRHGDYLIWITIVDQGHHPGNDTLVTELARQADQRLCTAVAC